MYSINKAEYLIVDMETTGIRKNDEIVKLTILDLDGNYLFRCFFNPNTYMTSEAFEKNKITYNMLKSQPKWSDKWFEIESILEGKILIIYSAAFGIRLINQTCKAFNITPNNIRAICLLKLYMHPDHKSKFVSLNIACERMRIVEELKEIKMLKLWNETIYRFDPMKKCCFIPIESICSIDKYKEYI